MTDHVRAIGVVLGVITSPGNAHARRMLRRFYATTAPDVADDVRVEMVMGDEFYGMPPRAERIDALADENVTYGDILHVHAREKLPHVGKAAEKSAAWWADVTRRVDARFYCKTDDDTLIHARRLLAVLEELDPSEPTIFSYIRWRGWMPRRFRACGGGWGGPKEAWEQISSPACPHTVGPFPQGTGQLTCLSASLARSLAHSAAFRTFREVAYARNTFGTSCASASACANASDATRMWHHEDAGISYNVWTTIATDRTGLKVVHVPERGWFWPWLHPKLQEASDRALFVHKVKPKLMPDVRTYWNVTTPMRRFQINCDRPCAAWGWSDARVEAVRELWHPWSGQTRTIRPSEIGVRCCFLDGV